MQTPVATSQIRTSATCPDQNPRRPTAIRRARKRLSRRTLYHAQQYLLQAAFAVP